MVDSELKTKIFFEISEIDELLLTDYMGFRHFFRHSYGYHLRWDLAQPLFENIHDTWDSIKSSILDFIN